MSVKPNMQTKVDTVESVPKRDDGLRYGCSSNTDCWSEAKHTVNKKSFCRTHLIEYCFDHCIKLPFKPRYENKSKGEGDEQ